MHARLNLAFLDALYVGGKLTASQREALLAGAHPAGLGLDAYDLYALTFGHCGAYQPPAPSPFGSVSARRPGKSALTAVPVAQESTPLLVENSSRIGLMIFNDGAQSMLLALDAAVSPTLFSLTLSPGALFVDSLGWPGAVSAMTLSGSVTARITELTS